MQINLNNDAFSIQPIIDCDKCDQKYSKYNYVQNILIFVFILCCSFQFTTLVKWLILDECLDQHSLSIKYYYDDFFSNKTLTN